MLPFIVSRCSRGLFTWLPMSDAFNGTNAKGFFYLRFYLYYRLPVPIIL